eukprot:3675881-Pyramimonas_sp.AAC.1
MAAGAPPAADDAFADATLRARRAARAPAARPAFSARMMLLIDGIRQASALLAPSCQAPSASNKRACT